MFQKFIVLFSLLIIVSISALNLRTGIKKIIKSPKDLVPLYQNISVQESTLTKKSHSKTRQKLQRQISSKNEELEQDKKNRPWFFQFKKKRAYKKDREKKKEKLKDLTGQYAKHSALQTCIDEYNTSMLNMEHSIQKTCSLNERSDKFTNYALGEINLFLDKLVKDGHFKSKEKAAEEIVDEDDDCRNYSDDDETIFNGADLGCVPITPKKFVELLETKAYLDYNSREKMTLFYNFMRGAEDLVSPYFDGKDPLPYRKDWHDYHPKVFGKKRESRPVQIPVKIECDKMVPPLSEREKKVLNYKSGQKECLYLTGVSYYELKELKFKDKRYNEWVKKVQDLHPQAFLTGTSGTTSRMLFLTHFLGANQEQLLNGRVALLGWMTGIDHSALEIMIPSKSFGLPFGSIRPDYYKDILPGDESFLAELTKNHGMDLPDKIYKKCEELNELDEKVSVDNHCELNPGQCYLGELFSRSSKFFKRLIGQSKDYKEKKKSKKDLNQKFEQFIKNTDPSLVPREIQAKDLFLDTMEHVKKYHHLGIDKRNFMKKAKEVLDHPSSNGQTKMYMYLLQKHLLALE